MLELQTLGGVALKRNGAPLAGPTARLRRIALLSILAADRTLGVSRDRLLALLWPEKHQTSARHALSQWLFLMRRDLDVPDLVIGTLQLRLNHQRIVADVTVCDAAIAAQDDATTATIYRGPFLESFFLNDAAGFTHRLDGERDRRHAAALSAIEATARRCEAPAHRPSHNLMPATSPPIRPLPCACYSPRSPRAWTPRASLLRLSGPAAYVIPIRHRSVMSARSSGCCSQAHRRCAVSCCAIGWIASNDYPSRSLSISRWRQSARWNVSSATIFRISTSRHVACALSAVRPFSLIWV